MLYNEGAAMNMLHARLRPILCGSVFTVMLFSTLAERVQAQSPPPANPSQRSVPGNLRGGGPAPSVTTFTVLNTGTSNNPVFIQFPTTTTLPYAPVSIRPLPNQIPTAPSSFNAALSSGALVNAGGFGTNSLAGGLGTNGLAGNSLLNNGLFGAGLGTNGLLGTNSLLGNGLGGLNGLGSFNSTTNITTATGANANSTVSATGTPLSPANFVLPTGTIYSNSNYLGYNGMQGPVPIFTGLGYSSISGNNALAGLNGLGVGGLNGLGVGGINGIGFNGVGGFGTFPAGGVGGYPGLGAGGLGGFPGLGGFGLGGLGYGGGLGNLGLGFGGILP
jgi:hypothetical protein